MRIVERRQPLAAAAAAGGGLLLVVGSLLNWSTLALNRGAGRLPGRAAGKFASRLAGRLGGGRLGPSISARGIDYFAGRAALVAGVALAMAGLTMWLARDARIRRSFAVGGTVAGAAAFAFVLDRIATGPIALGGRVPALGFLTSSLGAGMWIALAGALIGLGAAAFTAIFSEPEPVPAATVAPVAGPAGVPPSPVGPTLPDADATVLIPPPPHRDEPEQGDAA